MTWYQLQYKITAKKSLNNTLIFLALWDLTVLFESCLPLGLSNPSDTVVSDE